jgi:hypothetical protein
MTFAGGGASGSIQLVGCAAVLMVVHVFFVGEWSVDDRGSAEFLGGGLSLRAGMLRRNSCHGSFASIIAAGGGEIDVRGK